MPVLGRLYSIGLCPFLDPYPGRNPLDGFPLAVLVEFGRKLRGGMTLLSSYVEIWFTLFSSLERKVELYFSVL